MNQYSFPTQIYFGEGSSELLPKYLLEEQKKKPLIVTDESVRTLPFFNKIIDSLLPFEINISIYSDLHPNPLVSDVMNGVKQYKTESRDCIVAIGGGVAMDTARAIALMVNHQRDLLEYDDLQGGSKYITEEIPLLATIPTTSGTGSEVGRAAIISDDVSRQKHILFHPNLLAKRVFADPVLTYDLPPHITAATGMDALTHNVEAFLSKGYHPMADGIALEGVRMIFNSLEGAVVNPNSEARSEMMMASLMGAVAFQKGLGLVHSLAHPLSTLLDVHHGLANAIMIPFGLEFNLEGQEDRFKRLAVNIGCDSSSPSAFIDEVKKLRAKLQIPTLSSIGVKQEHISELVELTLKDFCLPSNPKEISRTEVEAIYERALTE
ncbi:iron-containing alcohol dehydrogenase [Sediminitomix flava]|uniref:Alcohol dehydrogenase class IV n=1 Tax=Sediminitomix flava TaxID=379075 RepID=A0A316A017_SEDFL|nr:iron-containing alcohol dehydrogenase [Sediminitomix flava]PWJ42987.1 alcohol dehydrogenase class IV [Sediminitomix flava]